MLALLAARPRLDSELAAVSTPECGLGPGLLLDDEAGVRGATGGLEQFSLVSGHDGPALRLDHLAKPPSAS
jgi:hypothetical protein